MTKLILKTLFTYVVIHFTALSVTSNYHPSNRSFISVAPLGQEDIAHIAQRHPDLKILSAKLKDDVITLGTALDGLRQLTVLELYRTEPVIMDELSLTDFLGDSLRGLPLKFLTLQQIGLTTLGGDLRGLPLRELDLSGNNLTAPGDSFHGLPLKDLDLSGNNLTAPGDSFHGLPLRDLDLSGNSLTTLGGDLRGLPLRYLSLYGNNFITLGYLPKTIIGLDIELTTLSTCFSSVMYLPKLQHLNMNYGLQALTSAEQFETFIASARSAINDPFALVKTKIVVIDALISMLSDSRPSDIPTSSIIPFITELRVATQEIEASAILNVDTGPIERLMQSTDLIAAMREILNSRLPTMREQLFSYDIQEQLSAIRIILAGLNTDSPVIRSINRILRPAREGVIASMQPFISLKRRRASVIKEQVSMLLIAMAEQATLMSLESQMTPESA